MTCQVTKDLVRDGNKRFRDQNPNHGKEHSKKVKKVWATKEGRAKYLKGFKQRPSQTEEKKRQISKTMKSVYALTDFPLRDKNENQSGEANHFYGKHHSQVTKELLSLSMKKWYDRNPEWVLWKLQAIKRYYANPTNLERHRAIMSKVTSFRRIGGNKGMSSYEEVVHKYLRTLGFQYDFMVKVVGKRKVGLNYYRVDFALPDFKFGIELDSQMHIKNSKRDEEKDRYLQSQDWTIVRIVFDSTKETQQDVLRKVKAFWENL